MGKIKKQIESSRRGVYSDSHYRKQIDLIRKFSAQIFLVILLLALLGTIFQSSTSASPILYRGLEARIDRDTFVGVDEESLDHYIKTLVTRDFYGSEELFQNGRIFLVKGNTRVLVLQVKIGLTKRRVEVRILEGENRGRSGWVPYEWVKAVSKEEIAPTASSTPPHVTVTGSLVNIRSGPGRNYSVISQSSKGDLLEVVERGEQWVKVKTNDGKVGWIHGSLVE